MNTVYPLARQRMLERVIAGSDLPAATFKAALVGTGYIYDSAHDELADISAHVLGDIVDLAGVTSLNGVLQANPAVITGLTPGDQAKAIVVFAEWTGGTLLFSYQGTASDGSLPATLSSSSAVIAWSPSGIFRL
jgi:hypothetical protein